MDLWDRDAIDLVGPAYIELHADALQFRFHCGRGVLDVKESDAGSGRGRVTWEGDATDQCRPWLAELKSDGPPRSRFLHLSDDSGLPSVALPNTE